MVGYSEKLMVREIAVMLERTKLGLTWMMRQRPG